MNLADEYYKLEEYKKAGEYYKLAMQNRKIYWACYYKLALCYVYSSDWANAEPMYAQMLKRDPENSSLQASLAYIYSMSGKTNKAIKLYASLLENQPNNEDYISNYLILILTDKRFFKKYRVSFEEFYATLSEDYSENKSLEKITGKYKEFAGIPEDEIDDDIESDDIEGDDAESDISEAGSPESSDMPSEENNS